MKDVFIDRRNVLTGITAVPLATTIPFIPNKETMFFGYNLLGKRVEDYKQLRYNLMKEYLFDCKDVVKIMYGDYIGTASWLDPNIEDIEIVVKTNDTMSFGYNLLGKKVEDYKQLRYNLIEAYMFDCKDVVKVMYGDYIGTAEWLAPNGKDIEVVVKTNDPRDRWTWCQTRDGVIYNKVQTDPQRGFPFISIEEHKKMFPNRWKNIT